MLDSLKKKKMLEALKGREEGTQFFQDKAEEGHESKREYINEMKKQGADRETIDFLMNGGNKKNNIADKPIYDAVKSVPVLDQLKASQQHMQELKSGDQRVIQDETEEEKRRRMLEGLFPLAKNQGLS